MDTDKVIELHKKMIEQGKIPKVLYKHTKITDGLKESIKNAELWFAAPKTFNDPFDCQINDQTSWTDDLIRDYVTRTNGLGGKMVNPENVVLANRRNPGSFSVLFTTAFKKTLSEIGVTCFLQKPDNLLLWAHYSDSHKGLCLQFDITKDSEFFTQTFAVRYSKLYPHFDYLTDRKDLTIKAILTKSDHWQYEGEIRTIQKTSGLYPFNKECLTGIIFGCKTDPNEITKLRQVVADANYPNLKFQQVTLRKNQYDIDILDI